MDNNSIVLGLDVSTKCIGMSIATIKDGNIKELLQVTHLRPKIPTKIKGIEGLFLKANLFKEKLEEYKIYGITDVIIEEPLISSNNQETVASLLKFNGIISYIVYECLNIIPQFISSYDARKFACPELMAIRKYNKKGDVYPSKKIITAIRHNDLVLFGAYPFDCAKKLILWNIICDKFPNIQWVYDDKGELKNENFDASDSLICIMGYLNKEKYMETKPLITNLNEVTIVEENKIILKYNTLFCDQNMEKTIELKISEQ